MKAILESPSYRVASEDSDFLASGSVRSLRLQMDYLKHELLLRGNNVLRTIVVFGSSRIFEPADARRRVESSISARPHPNHRVARRPRGQERALDPDEAVPRVHLPILAEAAMEGRLPRGFSIKRLTDLPMLWSEQWRAIGLRAPAQVQAEPG